MALAGITGASASFTTISSSNGITGPTGSFTFLSASQQISAPAGITGATGSFTFLTASQQISASAGITGTIGSFTNLTASQQISAPAGITGTIGSFTGLSSTSGITGPTGSFTHLSASQRILAPAGITGATGSFTFLTASQQISASAGITGAAASFTSISSSSGITGSNGSFSVLYADTISALSSKPYTVFDYRAFQILNSSSNYFNVNGPYGLAKNAYPAPDPYSNGVKATSIWNNRIQPNDISWYSICWSPKLNLFVAVSYTGSKFMRSSDGIIWTTIDIAGNRRWQTICWSAELEIFVAGAVNATGSDGYVIASSSDGLIWNLSLVYQYGFSVRSICWSPELKLFVGVSDMSQPHITYSSNGTSWILPNFTNNNAENRGEWHSICWAPELKLFVAVGDVGKNGTVLTTLSKIVVMTSSNGTGWTSRTAPESLWKSVCWSSQLNLLVAVGYSDNGVSGNRVMTSSNGIDWTVGTSADESSKWTSVAWSPALGQFIAVALETDKIMRSYDGINWSLINTSFSSDWRSICWSPELGIFCAVASSGTYRIMTSNLKARPPTSYNVFDSSFNNIDSYGNWTIQGTSFTSTQSVIIGSTGSNTIIQTGSNIIITGGITGPTGSFTHLSASQRISAPAGIVGTTGSFTSLSASQQISAPAGITGATGSFTNLIASQQISAPAGITGATGSFTHLSASQQISAPAGITGTTASFITISSTAGITGPTGSFTHLSSSNDTYLATTSGRGVGIGKNTVTSGISLDVNGNSVISGNISSGGTLFINGISNNSTALTITSLPGINFNGSIIGATGSFTHLSASQIISAPAGITGTTASFTTISFTAGITGPTGSFTHLSASQRISAPAGITGATGSFTDLIASRQISAPAGITGTVGSFTNLIITQQFSAPAGITGATGSFNILSATDPNSFIQFTNRAVQIIDSSSNFFNVNGPYGLAKNAYPAPNPYSNGVKAVSTWNRGLSPVDVAWSSVCWAPELRLFVAVGQTSGIHRAMRSSDGITWTTSIATDLSMNWRSVCWASELSLFVAVGTGTSTSTEFRVMTSSNGITWTGVITSGINFSWLSVCWSPELRRFVAVASDGVVMTSSNGSTWSPTSVETSNWESVCWSPELELFVAVASSGANRVMTSPDGLSWTPRSAAAANQWISVCWSSELNLFVAVANTNTTGTNRVMTSSDGINWTIRSATSNNDWRSVTWSPALGQFVAVASAGTNARIMTSYNGINWTERTPSDANFWWSVCWSPELGIFAAVSSSGTNSRAMYSSLQARPPTSYNVFDSSFNNIDSSGNWTIQGTSFTSSQAVTLGSTGSNTTIQSGGRIVLAGSVTGATGSFTAISSSAGITGPTGSFTFLTASQRISAPAGITGATGSFTTISSSAGITGPTGSFTFLTASQRISAPAGITGATGSFTHLSASQQISAPAGITGTIGSFTNLNISGSTFTDGLYVVDEVNTSPNSWIRLYSNGTSNQIQSYGNYGNLGLTNGSIANLYITNGGGSAANPYISIVPDTSSLGVNNTAKIGIGKLTPTYTLDVSGNANILTNDTSSNPILTLKNSKGLLSATQGDMCTLLRQELDSQNNIKLHTYFYRHSIGTDWLSVSTRIQNMVDFTQQAYIEFNPFGYNYGIAIKTSYTNYLSPTNNGGIIVNANGSVFIDTNTNSVPYLQINTDTNTNYWYSYKNYGLYELGFQKSNGTKAWTLYSDGSANFTGIVNAMNLVVSGNVGSNSPSVSVNDTSTSNNMIFVLNTGSGGWNPASQSGYQAIVAKGLAKNTSTLELTTHSDTNSAVIIKSSSVTMGAGGTSTTPTTSVECNGSNVVVQNTSTLSTTSGSYVTILTQNNKVNTNNIYLNTYVYRHTTVATDNGWTTASARIQYMVDSTFKSYIEFNPAGYSNGIAIKGYNSTSLPPSSPTNGGILIIESGGVIIPQNTGYNYYQTIYTDTTDNYWYYSKTSSNPNNYRFGHWNVGGSGWYINNDGSAVFGSTVTASSFNTTSDYRIKEDILDLSDEYTVDNLRPVTYKNLRTGKQDVGLIAHEVKEQYPFLVDGDKDGEEYQSVNYTGLIGILIKEIQDLKQRIKILENK